MRTAFPPDLILALSVIASITLLALLVSLWLNVTGIRRELERQGREQRERRQAG